MFGNNFIVKQIFNVISMYWISYLIVSLANSNNSRNRYYFFYQFFHYLTKIFELLILKLIFTSIPVIQEVFSLFVGWIAIYTLTNDEHVKICWHIQFKMIDRTDR